MRQKGNTFKVLVGKPEQDHLEELGVDGRVILKWILMKNLEATDWINVAGIEGKKFAGSSKHINLHSVS
jgi:hypothetical protein